MTRPGLGAGPSEKRPLVKLLVVLKIFLDLYLSHIHGHRFRNFLIVNGSLLDVSNMVIIEDGGLGKQSRLGMPCKLQLNSSYLRLYLNETKSLGCKSKQIPHTGDTNSLERCG